MSVDVPYFDGDTPDDETYTYAWTGTPHASPSTRSATPGLWVDDAPTPMPATGITVTGLDGSGPSRVTIYRSTPGGVRRIVRGWDRRLVFGSDYTIDYEVPLGRLVTYELVVVSGAVTPGRTSDTITITSSVGYIQDPLMPLGAVPVSSGVDVDSSAVLSATAFRKLEYAVSKTKMQPIGAREPVVFAGQRMAASGVDFSVLTEAAEQGSALRRLFLDTSLVLVRTLPQWGDLPDLFYTVPEVSEEPVYGDTGALMTTWRLSGDTVRPPSLQVLVSLWTYDQVEALWTTYAEAQAAADAAGATYLDDQRDPTMGV